MFAEFPTQTPTEWLEAINKILKGQPYEVLQTPLYEGFSTEPFYTNADSPAPLLHEVDFLPFHTCLNVIPIYASKVEEDLIIAQEYIDKGADAVCFLFQTTDADIEPYIAQCRVPFGVQVGKDWAGKLENVQASNDSWLFFEADALFSADAFRHIAQPYRKVLHTHFLQWDEAGASAVQTLAFGLSQLVEQIDQITEAGISPTEALSSVRATVGVGNQYFVEVAKLRALRVLWRNVVQAYQAPFEPIYVHACALERDKMQDDRYNNLLRNTSEAMAGIIGGADSFTVLPYTSPFSFLLLEDEDVTFAKRIARNTLLLLKEEAHLDKVTDASAGSYYIEWLTKQLAEKAWALFQEIESKGGFSKAQSFIEAQVAQTAQQRKANFEAGKTIVVGVNKYKNPKDDKLF